MENQQIKEEFLLKEHYLQRWFCLCKLKKRYKDFGPFVTKNEFKDFFHLQ
jgi:hypothetical protein